MSLLIVASAYAFSGGRTGNSETGCAPCHGSTAGPGTSVTIIGLPDPYEPGKNYSLTITVTSNVSGTGGGFDLSVSNGTLVVTDATNTQLMNGDLTHTAAGSGQRSWSFNWTAPPTDGDVTFYAAGLAADGDGGTSGDAWAIYSTVVIPEFPGVTLLLVLAAVTIVVLFFAKKMLPRVTIERKI
ncbi:MAG: Reeler domain-containing protein [Candidatus Bathyarchaeia archaeon]